jgi:hypothetical protein
MQQEIQALWDGEDGVTEHVKWLQHQVEGESSKKSKDRRAKSSPDDKYIANDAQGAETLSLDDVLHVLSEKTKGEHYSSCSPLKMVSTPYFGHALST